jgi:hypothetical protein
VISSTRREAVGSHRGWRAAAQHTQQSRIAAQ